MKKLPILALSALLLVACGNNDDHKKKDDKSKAEQKYKDKKEDKKKDTAKKKETEKKKTESKSSNEQSQQPQQENNQQQAQVQQNQQQQSQQVQQSQQQAQSGNAEACVLNSQQCDGLTEMQMIDAYKGLVSRGVLPQSDGTGNVGQAIKESKQMQQGMSHDEIVRQRYQSWVDAGIWTQDEMNQTMADYNANR